MIVRSREGTYLKLHNASRIYFPGFWSDSLSRVSMFIVQGLKIYPHRQRYHQAINCAIHWQTQHASSRTATLQPDSLFETSLGLAWLDWARLRVPSVPGDGRESFLPHKMQVIRMKAQVGGVWVCTHMGSSSVLAHSTRGC